MKTNSERMSQLLKRYGMDVNHRRIDNVKSSINQIRLDEKGNEKYRDEFLERLEGVTMGIWITNFEVFVEEMGLKPEWLELPDWFRSRLLVGRYMSGKKKYKLTDKLAIHHNTRNHQAMLEEPDFFINRMTEEKRNEFLLKQLFDSDCAQNELQDKVVGTLKELELETKKSQGFVLLKKEMDELICEEYEKVADFVKNSEDKKHIVRQWKF